MNSQIILQNYTNSASDISGLYEKLLLDQYVISVDSKTNSSNVIMLKVKFKVHDGIKYVTFYANGGFHLISGQNGRWMKSNAKTDNFPQQETFIDLYDGSENAFTPYYMGMDNEEMLCGRDVRFFGRDSQTIALAQHVISIHSLHELPFHRWGERLHVHRKKTHRRFTLSDFYEYLLRTATKRGISIVCERTFFGRHRLRYRAVMRMCLYGLKGNTRKHDKWLNEYRSETMMSGMIERMYNPTIRRKDCLAYKIYDEVGKGRLCVDLISNSTNGSIYMNERQSLLYSIERMGRAFLESHNGNAVHEYLRMSEGIYGLNMDKLRFKKNHLEKFTNKNKEFLSIMKFQEIKRTVDKKKRVRKNISLSFICSCNTSLPYVKRGRDGRLRRYKSYESYLKICEFLRKKA